MASPEMSPDKLREYVTYDRDTGKFYRGSKSKGKGKPVLLRETSKGYIKVQVQNRRYFAHRLAWYLVYGEWPDEMIDHISGDRSDNRIENLRVATASQNAANSKLYKSNTTGFKGVHERSPGRFRAYAFKDKKMIHLGTYSTAEEAHAVHVRASSELHGEFFREAA